MIDIHCHILPGIDDGAKTMTDALAMAQAAVKEGIHTVIATPHHQNGQYINERSSILNRVQGLNSYLQEENIPLTVLPGQETRLNGDMIQEIRRDILMPLNNTHYIFVEFPTRTVPRYASQMLFDLQVEGYIPVIVHPERNQMILEHPSILFDFVQNGALAQVTAASLVGKFSKRIEKFSHQLIDANLIHFFASDAHNTKKRGFVIQEAMQVIQAKHGRDTLGILMENAQLLVNDQNVMRYEPEPIKKKKFMGLF